MPDFQRVHGQAIIGCCEGDYRRMQNALRDRLIGYDAVRENWRDGNDRTGSDEKNAPADASQRRPNEDRPGTCPACRRNLWPLWTTPQTGDELDLTSWKPYRGSRSRTLLLAEWAQKDAHRNWEPSAIRVGVFDGGRLQFLLATKCLGLYP
jgi:hypothetical protein